MKMHATSIYREPPSRTLEYKRPSVIVSCSSSQHFKLDFERCNTRLSGGQDTDGDDDVAGLGLLSSENTTLGLVQAIFSRQFHEQVELQS